MDTAQQRYKETVDKALEEYITSLRQIAQERHAVLEKAQEESDAHHIRAISHTIHSIPSPKIVQRYEQALDDLVDDDQKLLTQNSPSAHYTYSIMKNRAENLENMDLRLHYTPLSDDTSEAR